MADRALMPRTPRHNIPGIVYHCIWRFVDRRWLLNDDEARSTYLTFLGKALEVSDWRCLAYALMSNHIHLALVAGRSPMESWTKCAHSPFARWLNKRHHGLGHVFADRAKDFGFVSHKVGGLLAYVHNNPVRAGLVAMARASTWTSHRAYAGLVQPPNWLAVDEGLRRAGFGDRKVFDAWVDSTPGQRCDEEFITERHELRRQGAIALGTPTADGDETMISLVTSSIAHIRPAPRQVIVRVADATGVGVPLICSRRRLPMIRAARTAVVKAGFALGITKSDLASALGISAQAVHVIANRESTDLEQRVIELVCDQLNVECWSRRHAG